ncbi:MULTISPECIES: MarR family winged helix-turn-helix transcriptional regulator [unclassified Novosphingobium]|uniref:MarR family winged helix-turn-helix transcriptional regulator n=1 Tax=unclassified Novosphingobium TaxID=2644732 RepID=UPI00020EEA8E|nr:MULTISPECIES: MarR family transcriptional regulator [unclassified Novosphingobium]GFM27555.1 MarR family transcriptional regulator [Novosphingobium sp. PY1]CCA92059.1 transcriptional regulator, MarR family [Novosphingobium sp. PP1Y]
MKKATTTSPRAKILHRVLKLSNRLLAPFSAHLEDQHRISLNEFRVLMLVGHLGRAASHEIVERTGVSAMSVSRAAITLERQDRIRIERDPANRRRKQITLTNEGQRLYRALQPNAGRVADYMLCNLQPHEIAMLDHILDTLIAALEATDENGHSSFLEFTKPENKQAPTP